MLGLIKKDLLLLKSNFKTYFLIIIVYVILAFTGEMNLMILPPFLSVLLMFTTFNYDNYNKWDSYALTFPNGRKNVVRAKYLTTLILITFTSLIFSLLALLLNYFHSQTFNFLETTVSMLATSCATIIIVSIMYPLIYKLGIEKARIGIFIIIFGLAILLGALSQVISFKNLTGTLNFLLTYWYLTIPLITIIAVIISYKVSWAIYKRKEF